MDFFALIAIESCVIFLANYSSVAGPAVPTVDPLSPLAAALLGIAFYQQVWDFLFSTPKLMPILIKATITSIATIFMAVGFGVQIGNERYVRGEYFGFPQHGMYENASFVVRVWFDFSYLL